MLCPTADHKVVMIQPRNGQMSLQDGKIITMEVIRQNTHRLFNTTLHKTLPRLFCFCHAVQK